MPFKTSRKIICLGVMLQVRCPLSLWNVEDLLYEHGVDVSYEIIRFWCHRFGQSLLVDVRKRLVEGIQYSRWRWHLDQMFVKIKAERM